MIITTPIILNGFVQIVPNWRASQGQPVYLYGDDFDSPYCPVSFEVTNDPV